MTVTKIDLGVEYLGGIAKPQTTDVGKFAVVRLDSLQRPNFNYETQIASVADNTFATALAPSLRGVGLTVDASGNLAPRQRPRNLQIKDHFVGGGLASGSIGGLNWSLLGSGTPVFTRVSTNNGIASTSRAELTTSASVNDRAVLCLGDAESRGIVMASEIAIAQCSWNHNGDLTNKKVFFGFKNDFSSDAASGANVLGIYYDAAVSPNYQIIARSGSVGSPTVTTSVVPANTAELITIYQATAGTYVFYVGNTAIGSLSSNIPTAGLNVGFRIETETGALRKVRLGYFGLECNLANAQDDDTFLEA